jgi:hypothetical protein
MIEADAVTADSAMKGTRRGVRIVLVCRVRDGIKAERQHEADEQRSRPCAIRSNLMEKVHARRREGNAPRLSEP